MFNPGLKIYKSDLVEIYAPNSNANLNRFTESFMLGLIVALAISAEPTGVPPQVALTMPRGGNAFLCVSLTDKVKDETTSFTGATYRLAPGFGELQQAEIPEVRFIWKPADRVLLHD